MIVFFTIFLFIFVWMLHLFLQKRHERNLLISENFFKKSGYEITKYTSWSKDEIHLIKDGVIVKKFIQKNPEDTLYTPWSQCEIDLIKYRKDLFGGHKS